MLNKLKGGIVLIPLLLLAGVITHDIYADALGKHKRDNLTVSITTAGDTAQVTTRMPVVAVDSFIYIDTFSYHADTTAHKTISWLSPLQVARITPTAVDSSTVYSCSVAFQAQTLGFDLDPGDAYVTVAKLCDTITYLFDNTTNLKDSVDAQDSTTYVKIVSKFGEVTLTGNWAVHYGVTGGTGTLDTTANGGSTVTTKAMVCDSMVAKINASANLDSFLTAAVTATDSTFTITSDDAGVLFWDSSLNDPDTYSTVTRTQANVTSWSSSSDTIEIDPAIVASNGVNWTGINSFFKIAASADTTWGIGAKDSVKLRLLSKRLKGAAWEITVLAEDSCAACPCSLEYVLPPDTARAAITIGENLFFYWLIKDSASDTTKDILYPVNLDYVLYNQK